MVRDRSPRSKFFVSIIYVFLFLTTLTCLVPFLNMLALSFSSSASAAANQVGIWPVEPNIKSYRFVLTDPAFVTSLFVSFQRLALGVSLNLFLIVTVAYPLSKSPEVFRPRTWYSWFFLITILFGGGLIPWYMTVKSTGILNTIWALVLPSSVPVFSMLVVLNFFRQLPRELEEAAFMDGATHSVLLWRIYVPVSKAALATVLLFCIVGHWNSWFDGLMLMTNPKNYPLQTYLQSVVIDPSTFFSQSRNNKEVMGQINERTTRAAQLMISMLPILFLYPFLQRYFATGMTLGSVKE